MKLLAPFRRLVLVLPLLGGLAGGAAAEPVVNVYNWADYIDPAVLQRFTRETGIAVRYDVYDSLETLEGKLSAGRSGYDVVVPTAEPTFARLIRAGALRRLDRAAIPHAAGLDPALMAQAAVADPNNAHGVIYLWGTIGVAVRPDLVAKFAPDAPADSLDLLLKPDNAKRLAQCGIQIMDSATDVVPSVLHWLGRDPDSADRADLDAAQQALLAIRPYVRAINSANMIDALATGEICAALSYSGDAIQAAARARDAGRGVQLRYVPPREGAELSFDMLAVPADAPHPLEAEKLIDFLLRPENMAAITSHVRYPNAVPASRPLIAAAVRDDPDVYPSAAALSRGFAPGSLTPVAERLRTRLWTHFKVGR